ncbi:MAG: 16S rRNA (uracil(1498)-N(3))-methyltransferase [Acidobacteria bacterium]|nr:16S rRNA (uracil(1498)-N(3))-methyltransferase [Acidobacteriota bacterium]
MTRRRWIADEVHGNTAALVGEHALHLVRVLRASVGQEFDIATGISVRRGTITSISDTRVDFLLGEEHSIPPAPDLTLALAIFKFDRMEWAIEKCTELGVTRIIPIIAQRTDSHLATAAAKRRERWQRLALQASEQSRRTAPPEIAAPIKLRDFCSVGDPPAEARKIVLAESENDTRLRDTLDSRPSPVVLAVGPEGGWAPDELRWFHDNHWIAASLGDTILRAETAAIVATALALDAFRSSGPV